MLRTWKQSPRRTPTFGLWSAAVIAADSLLVGARCALAAAVMASTPSAVAITASNLGRTLDMTCNVIFAGQGLPLADPAHAGQNTGLRRSLFAHGVR